MLTSVFDDAEAAVRKSKVAKQKKKELNDHFELLKYNLLTVYRSHVVRNSHQRRVRAMLMAQLDQTSCLILCDYMMKYLALIPVCVCSRLDPLRPFQ